MPKIAGGILVGDVWVISFEVTALINGDQTEDRVAVFVRIVNLERLGFSAYADPVQLQIPV
jgi:hypothetical protein